VDDIIVGSEALAAGLVTRQTLRTQYVKLHYNVYARKGVQLGATDRARAAWLWSRRTAILVGHSAAAMHGTQYLPDGAPAELGHANHPSPPGILIHRGTLAADEICLRQSVDCTTPARTAYDIGRRVSGDAAIIRIDAVLNATGCTVVEVERIADRYKGARGIRALRMALEIADGGAESPKETELRLLLVRDGLLRPVTQIVVPNPRGRSRRIDMGWAEWKVGVEYDGEQHWKNPNDYADDIERLEFLAAQRWIIIRVSSRQLRYDRAGILRRVRDALTRRGCPL
jgi:very-short-patch-repair endonuclease